MPSGELQIKTWSALVALLTVVVIGYIFIAQPEYLRASSSGTPYLTPPVENPIGGDPVRVDDLARHFKGEG